MSKKPLGREARVKFIMLHVHDMVREAGRVAALPLADQGAGTDKLREDFQKDIEEILDLEYMQGYRDCGEDVIQRINKLKDGQDNGEF